VLNKCVTGLFIVAAIGLMGWTSSNRKCCRGGACSTEIMLLDALHSSSQQLAQPAYEQLEVMPREVSPSALELHRQ